MVRKIKHISRFVGIVCLFEMLFINQCIVIIQHQVFRIQRFGCAKKCNLRINQTVQCTRSAAPAVMADLQQITLERLPIHGNDQIVRRVFGISGDHNGFIGNSDFEEQGRIIILFFVEQTEILTNQLLVGIQKVNFRIG